MHAVIMAGGSGTRFWPRSRRHIPKQLLAILGQNPLIRETYDRVAALSDPATTWVVTSEYHSARVRQALPEVPAANILGEPVGRDTAACIGLAAIKIRRQDPDALMLVVPADHFIRPRQKLHQIIRAGAEFATRRDALMVFGVTPRFPSTGYGYVKKGRKAGDVRGVSVFRVDGFREKPGKDTAEKLVASGDYLWNSGIFLWSASAILKALEKFAPALYRGLSNIAEVVGTSHEKSTVAREYEKLEKISIDYAVMERAEDVFLVEAELEWDDIGTWRSVEDLVSRNREGNVIVGKHCGLDTHNTIVFGDDHLIATVGLDNLIVVHTKDATLICRKDKAEDVKKLVEKLEKEGFADYV